MLRNLLISITCLFAWMPSVVSAQENDTIVKEPVERDSYAYTSSDVGAPAMLHLRTNLLYDALLLPSAGIELGLGSRWTFLAEGTVNWLSHNSKHRYYRVSSAAVEARYWIGGSVAAMLHRGHHLGVYAAAFRYDLEFGGKGQLADINLGGGFSYGYSTPIGRKLSLDFGLVMGYVGGKYKEYKPIDSHYVWQNTKTRHYFGPVKAEIALVWHIELKKKGGEKW